MRTFLLKALMLSYFLFSFANATHVHVDEHENVDDCQVCIIVKAFNDTDTPKISLDSVYKSCSYQVDIFTSLFVETSYLKGFFSHAPPLLPF